jgi:putative phosphoribosyl transferase
MGTATRMAPEGERSLWISAAGAALQATMFLPEHAWGMVIFAHGMGSNRNSPRNRFIAQMLRESKLGSLLIDLLSRDETMVDNLSGHYRFDVDLLARRVVGTIDWLQHNPECRDLRVGLFGAYTGAAAVLAAATMRSRRVDAVVSRGGRPDLAELYLNLVHQPTLFIVAAEDTPIINSNRQMIERLGGERRMEIIPGATHLFEEPGALELVAHLTRRWFENHLTHLVQVKSAFMMEPMQ